MYRESLYKHMCIDIQNLYRATLEGLWKPQQNIDPFAWTCCWQATEKTLRYILTDMSM